MDTLPELITSSSPIADDCRDGPCAHRRCIVPVTAEHLLSLKLPERPMVLAPILPAGGLALLYAPRGVGKTFLALSIGWAVASGGSLLRWHAPDARRVLYVDGEMPARTLQERLRRIIGTAGPAPADAARLLFLASDLTEFGLPTLAEEPGQRLVSEAAAGCDFVVLDNLSCLVPGIRENEGQDWGPIQTWLLALRRAGKAVLVVHHAGKNGDQRGTSRREDVLDLSIELQRPDGYREDEGARFNVRYRKARNLVGQDAERFEARLLEGPHGSLRWVDGAPHNPQQQQALAMLQRGESVRAVAAATGISKSAVHRLKAAVPLSQHQGGEPGTGDAGEALPNSWGPDDMPA